MAPSDLNGTWFEVGCGTNPAGVEGDGGFYGGTGIIHIFEEPSPLPSNTLGPTNTLPPTFTPSRTYTPSRTFTPSRVPSITMTRTPSRTPTASPTTAEPPPDDGEDIEGPDG
jgi:hypothetical protein